MMGGGRRLSRKHAGKTSLCFAGKAGSTSRRSYAEEQTSALCRRRWPYCPAPIKRRPTRNWRGAAAMTEATQAALLDIRDQVTVARNLITCVYIAAQGGLQAGSERGAICEVANAAREKLEQIGAALDGLIVGAMGET